MNINLSRFSEPIEAIIPVFNGYGVCGCRVFKWNDETGYYLAMLGDDVKKVGPANLIEVDEMLSQLSGFRGISYGDSIIPLNFSVSKFFGYSETIPCKFMSAEVGTTVVVRQWEDGTLLFHSIDSNSKAQFLILEVKKRAEEGTSLVGLKGITPEMRYFYLMLVLDKQRFEEWQNLDKLELSEEERRKRIKQFEESLAGRLQKAVEDAGGKLVRFNRRGNRIDITWRVGRQTFRSIVNQNFRVLELGFCASGYDSDHTISSAVILARQFVEEGLIYKTRE